MKGIFDFVSKKAKEWLATRRSSQLMNLVTELMTQSRQKLRVSDSPFRELGRNCIDKAEDAYQEALYEFKDGSAFVAFEYCRKSVKLLGLARSHMSSSAHDQVMELQFANDSDEAVIKELARAIASFKSVVEYTNCKISKEGQEQIVDCVRIFDSSLKRLADGDGDWARDTAITGLVQVYALGRTLEPGSATQVVDGGYLRKLGDSEVDRIVNLIDLIGDARQLQFESAEHAQVRVGPYLEAAQRTLGNCLKALQDGESIVNLAKAGTMETRMAIRLIESSWQPLCDEIELASESSPDSVEVFRLKIAKVQRVLRDNDPENSLKIVRRLHQVSTYFAKSVRLKKEGNLSQAERYARSAHLDIDYARQLLVDDAAFFSDVI